MKVVRWSRYLALAALLGCLSGRTALPQQLDRSDQRRMLRDALTAYDRGVRLLGEAPDQAMAAFQQARDAFQAVMDSGVVNGKLYYNLGNAHLRLSEIGEAIASYRRAERLIPGDSQLRRNLHFARSLCRDKIRASGERTFIQTVFFLHYSLALRTRLAIALIAYGLFWSLMMVRLFAPRIRMGYVTVLCLVVWISVGASIAISWPTTGQLSEGVLITDGVVVRKGNGETYNPQFAQPLHQGVEFRVLEERSGWVHIELPDSNRGWVRDREVTLF